MSIAAGDQVGRYEVVGELGAGGMGEVFRARDPRVDREVAIKVLPAQLVDDPELRARFEKEARAAGAINHPNLLTLHDVGDHDGTPYLVTELLAGETLRERLRREPLTRDEVIEMAQQIARGLAVVHGLDIIHRDIKPSNLFICSDGTIKILDFGLARHNNSEQGSGVDSTVAQTRTGAILGTPRYMSPEQVRGRQVDHRTDIFSLGVVIYEMVSGTPPFEGESEMEVAAAILDREPKRLDDRHLDRVVRRCLAKSPDDRMPSADDVIAALGASSQPRSRLGWVAAGVAAIAVGIATAVVLPSISGRSPPPSSATPVSSSATPLVDGRLSDRRITQRRDLPVWSVAVSTEGTLVAYASPEGLHIGPVDGEQAVIEVKSDYIALKPHDFYPDGRRLLVRTQNQEGNGLGVLDLETLAVTDLLGEAATDIVRARLSRDGAEIAFVDKRGINVMPSNGGTPELIAPIGATPPYSLAWSPTGERLAFIRYHGGTPGRLEIVRRDGRQVKALEVDGRLSQGFQRRAVEWLPSGHIVYGVASGHLGSELWAVDPDAVALAPVRLMAWPLNVVDALRFAAGRLFYVKTHIQADVFVADIAADGRWGETRRLTEHDDIDIFHAWSADNRVLFSSPRNGTWDLFAQSPDSSEASVIAGGPGAQVTARRTVDGVTYLDVPMSGPFATAGPCRLKRIDKSGIHDEGVEFRSRMGAREDPPMCVGGRRRCALRAPVCILGFRGWGGGVDARFRLYDHAQRKPGREFYRARAGTIVGGAGISPDGKTLALRVAPRERNRIALIDVATGVAREFEFEVDTAFPVYLSRWRADGRGFYAAAHSYQSTGLSELAGSQVISIDLDGSSRTVWKTQGNAPDPAPSPDGRHVALTHNRFDVDIWTLDGWR